MCAVWRPAPAAWLRGPVQGPGNFLLCPCQQRPLSLSPSLHWLSLQGFAEVLYKHYLQEGRLLWWALVWCVCTQRVRCCSECVTTWCDAHCVLGVCRAILCAVLPAAGAPPTAAEVPCRPCPAQLAVDPFCQLRAVCGCCQSLGCSCTRGTRPL